MAVQPPVKAFQCDQCPRSYSSKYALMRHARQHTNSHIRACPFCGRTSTRADIIRVHMNNCVKKCIRTLEETLQLQIKSGDSPYKVPIQPGPRFNVVPGNVPSETALLLESLQNPQLLDIRSPGISQGSKVMDIIANSSEYSQRKNWKFFFLFFTRSQTIFFIVMRTKNEILPFVQTSSKPNQGAEANKGQIKGTRTAYPCTISNNVAMYTQYSVHCILQFTFCMKLCVLDYIRIRQGVMPHWRWQISRVHGNRYQLRKYTFFSLFDIFRGFNWYRNYSLEWICIDAYCD